MNREDLYQLLPALAKKNANVTITFADGDRYSLRDLDFCKSLDSDEEPIEVKFADCIGESHVLRKALQPGGSKIPWVAWTSTSPSEPVGMRYSVGDIARVFDEDKGHFFFQDEK